MNLKIFFDPVEESLGDDMHDVQAIYHQLHINFGQSFPDWTAMDLVLIGLTENRGGGGSATLKTAPTAVRQQWYRLKRGAGPCRLADLGNLRAGRTYEETLERLTEVCRVLLEAGRTILLVGGTHDLHLGAYRAFAEAGQRITVLNVDARLDTEPSTWATPSHHHLMRLFAQRPSGLFNFVQIGHQAYLVDAQAQRDFEKSNYDSVRLGELRGDIGRAEPYCREAALFSFDVGALRQADAPGHAATRPFGLSGEEGCQLCWYAGCGPQLRVAGWYEFDPAYDVRAQTAATVAIMIWYFVEGFYHRVPMPTFADNACRRYVVPLADQELVFYKQLRTDMWWLEVPAPRPDAFPYRVPCHRQDYEQACGGELPERWVRTLARL